MVIRHQCSIVLGLIGLILSLTVQPVKAQLQVSDLRCEYLKDPVGIGVTAPRFSWKLYTESRNQYQTAYQVLAASSPEQLRENRADLWNSGKVDSDQSIHVEYAGRDLQSRDRCWWTVRAWDKDGKRSKWSEPAYFEIGLLSPEDWQAEWIKTSIRFDEYSYPSPMFRREFALEKKILRARAYITSLGLYELHINGRRVGDQVLTPGFTSYNKRLQHQVYDITSLLKEGDNAAGIILGNGWYRNFRAYPNEAPNMEERQRQDLFVIAQLEVFYTDGSKEIFPTGQKWKSSTGPILMTSIYNGETYDARLEQPGWSGPEFDDRGWKEIEVADLNRENIVTVSGPPIRRIGEIRPQKVIYTPAGDTLLDMGQNMAGWCRLKVKATEGTTITLRHAEMLDRHGNLYTDNLRTAKQTDRYTCRGGGQTETYEPRFTFHGFRYVAVSGYPGEVTPDILTGIVVHSDMERTGQFSCNDPGVNRLYQNILWTQKANSIDVPTDCPQRDERMGWTGDAQYFGPTACYNYQAHGFYAKWLKDLAADQAPSGMVYHTVPDKLGSGGAFGWSDAAVMVPWMLYRRYGDTRILEQQYESMKSWVDFQYHRSQDLNNLAWRGFGDWLAWEGDYRQHYSRGQPTDNDLLGTAYFYHVTDLFSKCADILGLQEAALEYGKLAERIAEAFREQFVTPTGRLSCGTQTAYAVSLSFGLLPEDKEKMASSRLASNVNDLGHIATGILGTRDISHALTEFGYPEEAYNLLFRENYPSWLYMVNMGATTIWERWDGLRPDTTFQKPQMNSFNHPALGSVGDWLYQKVAGIGQDPIVPGFKSIVIKPYPGGKMNEVTASYESIYGLIRSEWSQGEGKFRLTVEIPVNTSAWILVPSTGETLYMNGSPAGQVVKMDENIPAYHFLMIETGSGTWTFESDFK